MNTKILHVEKIVHGGLGLCRTDAGVVFAEGVLPGETIEAIVDSSSRVGGALIATNVSVMNASQERRQPMCPLFGCCGGCDWLHIVYGTQMSIKEEIFRESMARTGHVPDIGPLTVLASPEFGYRRRVQFKIDPEKGETGFFKRKSNSVVSISSCPLLCDQLNGLLDKLPLHTPSLGQAADCLKAIAGDRADGEAEEIQCPGVASFPMIRGMTSSRALIRCGLFEFPVSGNSFFQANLHMASGLATLVADWCNGDTFLDLYGGSGFFSTFVASKFKNGICVDDGSDHVTLARETLDRNGISSVAAEKSTVLDFLKRSIARKTRIDSCIIDPPRAGLERSAAHCLATMGPQRIIYVSCNPATQARDAGFLINQFGYTCEKAALVDCYPQTHHIETVLLLSKRQ